MKIKLKSIVFSLLVGFVMVGISGCKDKLKTGTFVLTFAPFVDGNPMELSTAYAGPNDVQYKVEFLKYYVSDITLIGADGNELVQDVMLVDEYDRTTRTISVEVPAGNYTGVRFGLGLNPTQNAADPATFATTHPQTYCRLQLVHIPGPSEKATSIVEIQKQWLIVNACSFPFLKLTFKQQVISAAS